MCSRFFKKEETTCDSIVQCAIYIQQHGMSDTCFDLHVCKWSMKAKMSNTLETDENHNVIKSAYRLHKRSYLLLFLNIICMPICYDCVENVMESSFSWKLYGPKRRKECATIMIIMKNGLQHLNDSLACDFLFLPHFLWFSVYWWK